MRANIFGDGRAEHDHAMLAHAFYEGQDYKTLFEDPDRFVVVGRRGTGKSALTYRLRRDWAERASRVVLFAPTEEEVIGLRPTAHLFGETTTRVRAGMKLAWRYAILMEIAGSLLENYKQKKVIEKSVLLHQHVRKWSSLGTSPTDRLRLCLREVLRQSDTSEDRIADIASFLKLNKITEEVSSAVEEAGQHFVVLIDRLDEGYESDQIGIGIVDGILYAVDEVKKILKDGFKPLVFIRDNILRAIQVEDKDFSRNLESQVLRLHWDPEELFHLAAKRIRSALGVDKENDLRVWNSVTSSELHGRDGFKRCLKLTLYRPRDLISLLNTAYYRATRQSRDTLIEEDFKSSAREISVNRLMDLSNEYESVFPGVGDYIVQFSDLQSTRLKVQEALDLLQKRAESDLFSASALQHFRIVGGAPGILTALYGVGFLGLLDREHNSFVFSHDGRTPKKSLGTEDVLMVHPCYWEALGLAVDGIDESSADEIFDEYEVKITSESTEQRRKALGKIIAELNEIPSGTEGAEQFEDWAKRAIEIAFARQLSNVQLKPNASAVQRRDIVATNQGQGGFWKRVLKDYGTRQVIFEIKNYEKMSIEEYRQVSTYLGKEYGSFGLIVCRDKDAALRKGGDLECFREFYGKNQVIMKIPASLLVMILSKLRSPEKYDAGNALLEKLVDTYVRMYASGQTDSTNAKRRGKRA